MHKHLSTGIRIERIEERMQVVQGRPVPKHRDRHIGHSKRGHQPRLVGQGVGRRWGGQVDHDLVAGLADGPKLGLGRLAGSADQRREGEVVEDVFDRIGR